MGAVGGYRLVGGTAMPPLLLDDEEAVAIAVGLRTLVAHAIEGGEDASVRALAKLQQVLPPRLRARVAAVAAATGALVWDADPIDPERLAVLSRAVVNRRPLRFEYEAADRSSSRRTVEPHSVVAAGRRWYLIAWDTDRGDWRTFRVDRMAILGPCQGTSRRASCRRRTGRHGCARPSRASRRWRKRWRWSRRQHPRWPRGSRMAPAPWSRSTSDAVAYDSTPTRSHGRRCVSSGSRRTSWWNRPPELVDYLRAIGKRVTHAISRA